jgi:hypothetical protein
MEKWVNPTRKSTDYTLYGATEIGVTTLAAYLGSNIDRQTFTTWGIGITYTITKKSKLVFEATGEVNDGMSLRCCDLHSFRIFHDF